MAASGPPPDEWFEEFKKANQGASPAPRDAAGKERRRHPRFDTEEVRVCLTEEGLLSVFGLGKSNKALKALDLSEGGVRLQTTERLKPGVKVRIRLEIEKYQDAIEAVGEVRWSHQGGPRKTDFFAGIMFVKLDSGQLRKIALMREWFQSPQYKAMKVARLKQERNAGGLIFPK